MLICRTINCLARRSARTVWAFSMLACLLHSFASAARSEDKTTLPPSQVNDPNREPIPSDFAPDDIKRMIQDGKVTVVYDSEPEFVKAGRGWADFHIQLKHTFKYDMTKQLKKNRWQVKVTVTKFESQMELTHLVRMPAPTKSPTIWQSQLLRHEFDHVAVGLDPRPLMLLKYLLNRLPTMERTLEPKQKPSNELITKWIDEAIDARLTAVRSIITQNNITLDKVSQHGGIPVPERAAFFAKLYTKENLAELKFPFIDDVLPLLESPDYQAAEPRFLPRDPTEVAPPEN